MPGSSGSPLGRFALVGVVNTAIDFAIPSVPPQALETWARAQKLGGVGFYPESGFVHMDTGPIRTWSGE